MEEIDNIINEYNLAKKQMEDKIKSAFISCLKQFFSEHEYIKAIVWTQYTPYWNDGEECEFGKNEFTVTNAENDILKDNLLDIAYNNSTNRDDFDPSNDEYWTEQSYQNKDLDKLEKSLKKIPDEIYKSAFGDHVVVAIKHTLDVIIREYDHE